MTQVLSTPIACSPMDGPFGYAFFDGRSDEPAPPSQPPIHSRPLLSDSDTSQTNRLFSGLADPHLLESLTQYQVEPIPNLYGSSSHFGHPEMDPLSRALGPFHHGNMFSPGPLTAPAQTHMYPGQQPQGFGFGLPQSQPPLPPPPPPPPPPMMHPRTQSMSFAKPGQNIAPKPMRQPLPRRASEIAPVTLGDETYVHTAREMLKEGRDARPDSYLERRMTFTYGSDKGFKGDSYMPPEQLRKHQKALEEQKLDIGHIGYKVRSRRDDESHGVEALEEVPMTARSSALESMPDESMMHSGNGNGNGNGMHRKRGRNEDDDDAETEGAAAPTNRKKTKPSISTNVGGNVNDPRSPSGASRTPASAGGLGRKPDGPGSAKPTRVNLTEEEKKMNHIRSEQKRRNQIKEGFADLTELMPDAASAGPSKCTVLAKAVEWLNDLIEGNKQLKKQLSVIKGGNGATVERLR